MATIATRTIAFLKAQSTVVAYVKTAIFETHPTERVDPYIVIRRVSSENADVLNGSAGDAPLFYGLEIECTSEKEWQANAVADAVRTAIHLYRGTFDDSTAKGCFVDSDSLDFQAYQEGSDEGKYTRRLETRIAL